MSLELVAALGSMGVVLVVQAMDRIIMRLREGRLTRRLWSRCRPGYGWPRPWVAPVDVAAHPSRPPSWNPMADVAPSDWTAADVEWDWARRAALRREAPELAERTEGVEAKVSLMLALVNRRPEMSAAVGMANRDPRLVTPEEARRARNMAAQEETGVYQRRGNCVVHRPTGYCIACGRPGRECP